MRYIIGVDLGTTNCCVSFVDTHDPKLAPQPFRVPQLHKLGHVEALSTLPSFCYCASSTALPWDDAPPYVVGAFAREEGAKTPTKLVESAKSWLCHSGADSRSVLLPVEAAAEGGRITPIEASARYLKHLKDAWNHVKGRKGDDALFEEQDIVLTVPASFDEAARSLTVEAARLAGISQLTLLEEPQAAFYSWLAQHENVWKDLLKEGDSVLVCDVGGGTTDFSLIDVCRDGDELSLRRMAVGDHLLLGGDNMDIAVAHYIEGCIAKGELPVAQWLQLRHQARKAKELLFDDEGQEQVYRFLLQGGGSGVVAGTLGSEIARGELQRLLLEGFFPDLSWEEALQLKQSSGVKTMGLPYEVEPAITRHLAAFLRSTGPQPVAPDYVLFNGGAMKPAAFRQSVIASLGRWFPHKKVAALLSFHLDLAVARGAAYYGRVRRGLGIRIGGGSARGYYLGVDDGGEKKAVSLLPRGSEEGASYELAQRFMLRPNTPVAFTLYASHVRLSDAPGVVLPIDPKELQPLPPIHTVLRFGKGQAAEQLVPVKLGIALTAIGTVSLWLKAVDTPHRWDLEFQLRSAEGKEQTAAALRSDETFDVNFLAKAKEEIGSAYNSGKTDRLMESLEELLERPRRDWPPSILRGLWEAAVAAGPRRKSSADAEARWWNLSGFLLRPGFGYPLDDFRVKELWKAVLADGKGTRPPDVDMQRWICLRRIAGGLSRGQQAQIAAELWPLLIDKGKIVFKGKGETYTYSERLRTAASLELVDPALKVKLGNAILARIAKEEPLSVELWALGRLGARHLFHGAASHVVGRDIALAWVEKLADRQKRDEAWAFAVGLIARKTDQRELNLPEEAIGRLLERVPEGEGALRLKTLLTDASPLTQNEQNKVFGEQLPAGLTLL